MLGDNESEIELADRAVALNANFIFRNGKTEAGSTRLRDCTRKRSGALSTPCVSYDWWNFIVDTGHVPSWPLMEIRGREIHPTRDSLLCASDPIGQDDGLPEEFI